LFQLDLKLKIHISQTTDARRKTTATASSMAEVCGATADTLADFDGRFEFPEIWGKE